MEKGQMRAPVYEALEKLKKRRVVPFDVPGHKRGRGNPELVELLGEKCVSLDVNSMKPLDNLCHPVSVLRDAQQLAAEQGISTMSAQAVGGAVGHNKISIIIPCHRVIGADGSLTGYAGGIHQKIALLKLEDTDKYESLCSTNIG